MTTPQPLYDATPTTQGEGTVNVAPTHALATTWANGLIAELRKDKALLNRLISAVNNEHGGITVGSGRAETVNRLAILIRKATTTELDKADVDLLVDDLADALLRPDCDEPECHQPEHSQGWCWDHLAEREARVSAKAGRSA